MANEKSILTEEEFINGNHFDSMEEMFQELHKKYPLGLITRAEFHNKMDEVKEYLIERIDQNYETLRREHKEDITNINGRIDNIRNAGIIGSIIASVLAYFGLTS